MCKAFTWAHEADPDAELFYNDFNHASMDSYWGRKATAVYNMIKELKDRDCPIHGIGFQLHQDVDFEPHVEAMKFNLLRYQ